MQKIMYAISNRNWFINLFQRGSFWFVPGLQMNFLDIVVFDYCTRFQLMLNLHGYNDSGKIEKLYILLKRYFYTFMHGSKLHLKV